METSVAVVWVFLLVCSTIVLCQGMIYYQEIMFFAKGKIKVVKEIRNDSFAEKITRTYWEDKK